MMFWVIYAIKIYSLLLNKFIPLFKRYKFVEFFLLQLVSTKSFCKNKNIIITQRRKKSLAFKLKLIKDLWNQIFVFLNLYYYENESFKSN